MPRRRGLPRRSLPRRSLPRRSLPRRSLPRRSLPRRSLPSLAATALAAALTLGPLLTGCSAGQVTQTDTQVSGVNGAEGRAGSILVHDAVFAHPSSLTGSYPVGADAPLSASIVNESGIADRLVSASSPAARSVTISGSTTIPGDSLVTVSPPGTESTTPPPLSDTASPTNLPLPSSFPLPVPGTPVPATPSVSPGTLSVGTVQIVLTGLDQEVSPGLTYPVTLVFANGGSMTLPIPVGDPRSAVS